MPSSSDGDKSGTVENDISGSMPQKMQDASGIILRPTSHEADVHFCNVWSTDWEKKIGVKSKREYSYIFSDELEWERSHHRWESDRVEDTDMWEIDLDSVFYVACVCLQEGLTVTIDDDVWAGYMSQEHRT